MKPHCFLAVLMLGTLATQSATFTVTSVADSGPGSLRQAINDANLNPDPDTMVFDIPGTGPQRIDLLTQLPKIISPVVIDGATQPGFSGTPLIELRGTLVTDSDAGEIAGIRIQTRDCVVRSLCIHGFKGDGIRIGSDASASNNVVSGCHLGTDITGTLALGNGLNGLAIGGTRTLVGGTAPGAGNLISGNNGFGVRIEGSFATHNLVLGNRIGTDITGGKAVPNKGAGVRIMGGASFNRIGGTDPGARNVIAGNLQDGVSIEGPAARANVVQGNLLGTDISGTHRLPNAGNGVWVGNLAEDTIVGGPDPGAGNLSSGNGQGGFSFTQGPRRTVLQGNIAGTDITGTKKLPNNWASVILASGATGSLIGGTRTGEGNLISGGNAEGGIYIVDANTTNNVIQGNRIGTDLNGTQALGNIAAGIHVKSPSNRIGGADTGAGNVIAGNGSHGILFDGPLATNNVVLGNSIGTDSTATLRIANRGAGVNVASASGNQIGGINAGEGNHIRFNGGAGVRLSSGTRNSIRGNDIVANGGLAIDLGGIGVTANDSLDSDGGANLLQNFPLLSQVSGIQSFLLLGSLNSRPGSTFLVDAYTASIGTTPESSHIGTAVVTTDAEGNAAFELTLPGPIIGREITATATDAAGNTSEMSKALNTGETMSVAPPAITRQPVAQRVAEGSTVSLSVEATGGGLRYQWFRGPTVLNGEVGATLMLTNATAANSGNYSVSVTNSLGGATEDAIVIVSSEPAGELWVNSFSNGTILRYDTATRAYLGNVVTGIPGGLQNFELGFDGLLYCASAFSNAVYRVNPTDGTILGQFIKPSGSVNFGNTIGLTFGPNGRLYVGSWGTSQILAFEGLSGRFDGVVARSGNPTGFAGGNDIAVGHDGTVFVSSYGDGSIKSFTTNHEFLRSTVPAKTTALNNLTAFTILSDGNFLAADGSDRGSIYLVNASSGLVDRVFVQNGSGGLRAPGGLRVGPDGLIYVVDFSNSTVLRYNSANGEFIDRFDHPAPGGWDWFWLRLVPATSAAAPRIAWEPADFQGPAGTSELLSVTASGTPPLHFQWRHDSIPITSATQSSLSVILSSQEAAGAYDVVVSNLLGAVTSRVARVTLQPCISLSPGIVAWWPGESHGTDVIRGQMATLQGGVRYGDGRVGKAFRFDGSNARLEIQHDPALFPGTNSMAIAAWIRTTRTAGLGPIFSKYEAGGNGDVGKSWFSFAVRNGRLEGRIRDTDGGGPDPESDQRITGTKGVADGVFHHVVFQRDVETERLSLWVDGRLDAEEPLHPSMRGPIQDDDGMADPFLMGAEYASQSTTFSGVFQGEIDEVMVAKRRLSAEEIAGIFGAGGAGACSPPIVIVESPPSQRVALGSRVLLEVAAIGSRPLTYQWRLNGQNLESATNAVLDLPAVVVADGGVYSALISDGENAVESASAVLDVELESLALVDRFGDRLVVVASSGIGRTNNQAATGETASGEPKHAGKRGGKSLWMTWRPGQTGVATFRTAGSGFDTLLAVYEGVVLGNLVEVAGDDDSGGFLTSQVRFNAVAGQEYQIAVDGFAGASGTVVLSWSLVAAAPVLPEILRQPADRLGVVGDPVALTVAASPPGVTYQWFRNGVSLVGRTGPVLAFDAIRPADAGTYKVRVQAPNGAALDSDDAVVDVVDQAVGRAASLSADKVDDLFSDEELRGGASPALHAAASGTALTVGTGLGGSQWTDTRRSSRSLEEPRVCDIATTATRWFRLRFELPAGNTKALELNSEGSEIPAMIAVFTNRAALTLVGCDVAAPPTKSAAKVSWVPQRGLDYLVLVDGIRGARGRIQLNRVLEPEANPLKPTEFGLRAGRMVIRMYPLPGLYDWQMGPGLESMQTLFRTNLTAGEFQFEEPEAAVTPSRIFQLKAVVGGALPSPNP